MLLIKRTNSINFINSPDLQVSLNFILSSVRHGPMLMEEDQGFLRVK